MVGVCKGRGQLADGSCIKWHWGPREIGVTSLVIVGSEDQVIILAPLDNGMPQGYWNGPL